MSNSMTEGRCGKFSVRVKVLEKATHGQLNQLFQDMVIVRAEMHYGSRSIEYIAYCPFFEPISEGVMIPEYKVELFLSENSDRVSIVWDHMIPPVSDG